MYEGMRLRNRSCPAVSLQGLEGRARTRQRGWGGAAGQAHAAGHPRSLQSSDSSQRASPEQQQEQQQQPAGPRPGKAAEPFTVWAKPAEFPAGGCCGAAAACRPAPLAGGIVVAPGAAPRCSWAAASCRGSHTTAPAAAARGMQSAGSGKFPLYLKEGPLSKGYFTVSSEPMPALPARLLGAAHAWHRTGRLSCRSVCRMRCAPLGGVAHWAVKTR